MARGGKRAAVTCSNSGTTGSGLLDVLAGGLGIVADKVVGSLARGDRVSLGLACKALQDEVATRWRCLCIGSSPAAAVLRSKLLPKLRSVEELKIHATVYRDGSQARDFYRLLLELQRNGARIKALDMTWSTSTRRPLRLPRRRSARLAGQQATQSHDGWVLTAESLQELQPVPHLERLYGRLHAEVDAALLQPLLRTPTLQSVRLAGVLRLAGGNLDLGACSQLRELCLLNPPYHSGPSMGLAACMRGLQPPASLKRLEVCGFEARWQCMQHISRSLPRLETLCLHDCRLLEPDAGAGQHESQQPLFPGLKELQLYCASSAPSGMLSRRLFGATRLQRLTLAFMGIGVSHAGVPEAVPFDSPSLAHLEELVIRETSMPREMITAVLEKLAKNQRRLRMMTIAEYDYISGTRQLITQQDLRAFLGAAPPGLKELRLHGFTTDVRRALLVQQAAAASVHLEILSAPDDY